ncbi:MAG: recombinase family protein [Defluviitaleaceae bacterium]|nr:recombinase family protein [Defluviitaleaceae bacterium]
MTNQLSCKPIPAVIYARFSSHSQNEQSIEGQLKACYEYAERQGYKVIGEYIDRALSGTTDNRPEFLRMIEDSSKRRFEVIIVYQLDRFARNRYDSATYKARLKKNGVKVVSARENISDDASGVLMEALLEGMAEYYSVELGQKIRRGMDINASKCLATGSNPGLGFKVDSDRRYYIDEQEAVVVRRIFEMYAAGQTVKEITDYLNRQQIKTSKGGEFNKNSLRSMLRNKRYIGTYMYRGIETPNGMPRIISDELFEKVQDIMNKNKKAPARARAKEEYLLTTKLFCGHCREMMTGISGTSKTGAIHNYYTCNGRKKKQCDKKNVQKDYIEDMVVNLARNQLTDENINAIASAVATLCEKEKDSPNMMRLTGLIRENDKAVNNLLNALEQGQAADLITQRLEKKRVEKEMLEEEVYRESANFVDLTAPEIRFFLTQMRDGDVNDETNRRLLITVLINAVYLYDNKYTVIFNAADKPVEVTHSLIDEIEAATEKFVYEQDCSIKKP